MELMTMVQETNQDGDYKLLPSMALIEFDDEEDGNDEDNKSAIKREIYYDGPNLEMSIGHHTHMRKMVNKLGGTYCSGKPLSLVTRRQIVAMADTGMKACDISRQLQISHGCVSKIIAKWRSTGSFEPRRIGGSKPKKTIGDVVAAVRRYKRSSPSVRSLEIRRKLLEDGVCNECNVPSLSSINRIIRMKLREDLAEFEANAVRDLMDLLATSTTPTSAAGSSEEPPRSNVIPMPPQHVKLPVVLSTPESEPSINRSNGPPTNIQAILKSEPEQPDDVDQFNCGPVFYEMNKLQSSLLLPHNSTHISTQHQLQQQHFPHVQPITHEDQNTTTTRAMMIPMARYVRNTSTGSTISNASSNGSSFSSGSDRSPSFDLNGGGCGISTWNDDLGSSGHQSENEAHDGMYSNGYGMNNDMMNVGLMNFDNDELWSLLDELPN